MVEGRRIATTGGALVSALVLAASTACSASSPQGGAAALVIRLPSGPAPDLAALTFEPPGHVKSLRLDDNRNLSVETDGSALVARLPELCPIPIPAGGAATPTVVVARSRLDVGRDLAQVGYDAPFEIVAARGCPEAAEGRLEFRQIEGPPLADWSFDSSGDRLRARTLPLAHFFSGPLPVGVVAVSPRTQGRYAIEATLSGGGGPSVRRVVVVTSMARATGLSNLAVSQRVMLGGAGWQVERAPFGGRAQVEVFGGVPTFQPDVAGRWTLADAGGRQLGVPSMTHDRTPLDCGRAECHASISAAAVATPMSEALVRPLRPPHPTPANEGCLLDCHVVGERGLHDGGFLDNAAALGFRSPGPLSFDALPHALQRLGGVRCSSCHGPGAIPEPGDRARILRVSVCATCHDAPPANTHVDAWSRSAMARSDQLPETRGNAACGRCHTTGGFLDALGVRRRADASRDPDDASVGISCAACHAVHGDHVAETLVRAVEPPPSVGHSGPLTASSVCSNCHAPVRDEFIPSASSAVLVAGRVVLPDALGGAEHEGPAPHATLPGGCMSCHGAASAGAPGGTDHSFRVDRATCAGCHSAADPPEQRNGAGRTVRERAQALVLELRGACGAGESIGKQHSSPQRLDACALPPETARALFLASLVLEDDAAALHNAPFSRSLLDRAETILSSLRAGARAHAPKP